jgi:hypothetical protein
MPAILCLFSEPVFVNVYGAQGIDSEESISPAYVVWRAGTKNRVVVPARQAGNRYLVSLKDLRIPALRQQNLLDWKSRRQQLE